MNMRECFIVKFIGGFSFARKWVTARLLVAGRFETCQRPHFNLTRPVPKWVVSYWISPKQTFSGVSGSSRI